MKVLYNLYPSVASSLTLWILQTTKRIVEHSSKNETVSIYKRGEIYESSIFSDFDKSNSGKISLGSLQVSICHPPALPDKNLTCVGRYEEGRCQPHGRGDGGHHQQA